MIQSNIEDVIKKIIKREGSMGLYRGYFAYTASYAPGNV